MPDEDHPLSAPNDETLDALEPPRVAAGLNGGSSTATVKAMADALLLPPPQPRPPQPSRPPLPPHLPSRPAAGPLLLPPSAVTTGRASSIAVLAATGPWARGEAAIVVTPAARVRGGGGEASSATAAAAATTSGTRTLLAIVEASTGRILHDPAPGVGTFDSEADALRALSDTWGNVVSESEASSSAPPFHVLARGCALLGYLRGGPRSGAGRAVLLATGARLGAQLPGGHLVRAVTSAAWVSLPTPATHENDAGGLNDESRDGGNGDGDDDDDVALSALAEAAARFKLDGSHYFCETADVTRPFPGRRGLRRESPPRNIDDKNENENERLGEERGEERGEGGEGGDGPSWEFVWNAAVAAPLRAAGLGDAVPHLLQGVAESRSVALSRERKARKERKGERREGDGAAAAAAAAASTSTTTTTAAATLVLLTRASRLHAGTRYRARGLNALASPGNEIEVEQILWCANNVDDDDESGADGGDDGEGGGERKGRSGGASTSSSSSSSPSSSSLTSSASISFSAVSWRRGTVPLWWGVEIRGGGVGEAAIVVAGHGGGSGGGGGQNQQQQGRNQPQNQQHPQQQQRRVAVDPYEGTRRYFRRLQRRFAWPEEEAKGREKAEEQTTAAATMAVATEAAAAAEAAAAKPPRNSSADPSLLVPVHCVNLLRCSMSRHDELLLSEHFAEGLRRAKAGAKRSGGGASTRPRGGAGVAATTEKRHRPPPLPLQCLNFDWHGVIKELGESGAVDGLWASLAPIVDGIGLTSGKLVPLEKGGGEENGRNPAAAATVAHWPGFQVSLSSRQRGLLRYNCADSLDRTNAASYFGGVLFLAEQCHALGLRALPGSFSGAAVAAAATASSLAPLSAVVKGRGGGGGAGGALAPPLPPPPPPLPTTVPLASLEPTLPAGWGAFLHVPSGRVGFLDHGRRETTWSAPPGVDASAVERAAAAAAAAVAAAAAAAAAAVPDSSSAPTPSPPPLQSLPLPRSAALASAGASSPLARRALPRPLLTSHADVFRIAGDVHAHLYTASPAMHSGILGLLLVDHDERDDSGGEREAGASDGEGASEDSGGGEGGASSASEDEGGGAPSSSSRASAAAAAAAASLFTRKKPSSSTGASAARRKKNSSSALERAARAGVGRLRNATLSVQRRWANLTADSGRQAAIDAFLGLRPAAAAAATLAASADAAAAGSGSASSSGERLPPVYLCAGAEVPLEHEGPDSDDDEEEEEEGEREEEEQQQQQQQHQQQQQSSSEDVVAIQDALAASSVGGGEGESRERRQQELLHPLDGKQMPQPEWQDARSLAHVDALVREYLLFRGFANAARAAAQDAVADPGMGFQADAITDYVFRDLIPSANSEELLSLLSFLSQRVFGRAPPRLAAAGVAAETAALRAFVVAAIKAGNPKAALDLLAAKAHELMGADASSAADWAPWYALPHLSGSSSASFVFPRCSRALNDPAWAREAEATFRNALAEAACALPPPALLRLGRAGNRSEKEVAARAAELEAENARLRARVEALERACGADGVAASAAGAATKSVRAATSNGGGRGEKATAGSAAAAAPSRARTATTPPPPRAAAAAAPLAASPPMWSWSPASSSLTK